MPGTERSGRRKIARPEGLKFPRLGADEDSVRRYLAAVARYLGEGVLDPRVADSMTAAAKGSLQAITARAKRLEVEELNALVKRAEQATRGETGDAAGTADASDPTDPGTAPG